MTTVNKPILLDETGKDIASAVREQTQALQTAIQSISIGGGSGGGGDDGYFPRNVMELTMDHNLLAEDGTVYVKVYDPSTSEFPPPKYISVMAMEETNVYVMGVVATEEELLQWDGAVGGDIAGASAVLNTVSMMGTTAQIGIFPVPKADNKPLWVGFINGLYVLPSYGFY